MSETRTNATQQITVLLQRVGYPEGDIWSAARGGGGSMRESALDVLKPGEVPEPDLVDWEAVADSFDRRGFGPLGPAGARGACGARAGGAPGGGVSADALASLNMAVAALDKAVAIFEAGE